MLRLIVALCILVATFVASLWNETGPAAGRMHGLADLGVGRTLFQYLLAAAQGLSLVAIVVELRRDAGRAALAATALGGAALWTVAVLWPHTFSADPYAYVAYAKLPTAAAAYAPPAVAWSPAFAVIPSDWGNPVVPCVYGPLWIAIDRLAASWVPSAATGLAVERALAVLGYALAVVALRWAGAPFPLVVAAALEPAAARAFGVGAHNDALALAAIVIAFAAVTARRWPAAFAAITAAAAIKIAFVAFAPIVFAQVSSWRFRLAAASAAGFAAVAVTAAGGAPYLHAMSHVGSTAWSSATHGGARWSLVLTKDAGAAIAVAALALLLLPRPRTWAPATWTFWTISAAWFPWYLSWCLPYALRTRTLFAFLAVWPLAGAMIEHSLPHVYPFYLLAVYLAWEALRLVRADGFDGIIARVGDWRRAETPAG